MQALCIGSTNGIGKGLALALAAKKVNLTVVGRSEEAGQEVLALCRKVNPTGTYDFFKCDVSLIKAIDAFSSEYIKTHTKIDFLILSQGIASMNGRTETNEGIDRKLAIHFYGRMAFIQNLLPKLLNSESPKIISILSGGVHSSYTNKNDLALKDNFSIKNAADAAGFYNDLFLDKLSLSNPTVSFQHAAPGFVASNWGSDFNFLIRGPLRLLQWSFGRSIESCGEILTTAMMQRGPGFHIFGSNGDVASKTSDHSEEMRNIVYEHTQETLKNARA